MDDERRMRARTTVFSTWVVLGLFLDGWAHNADKPETFWTPYHAVLYSGFAAAAITFALERRRHRRSGTVAPVDRLTHAGFLLFALAGVGDAVWHEVFGVEEDVAALLSPTHLALMLGGLFLVTAPLRRPVAMSSGRWRDSSPDVAAVTLAVAVVAFFLQFLSAFHGVHGDHFGVAATADGELLGVASLLVTNALLIGGLAWLVARWTTPPAGAATVVVASTALLLSSQEGFEGVELVLAAVAAGAVADLLLRRGASTRLVLLTAPAVLWPVWFAVYELRWGLGWPAEYWTGVTVLSALSGWGLTLLVGARTAARPTGSHVLPRVEAEVRPTARRATTSLAGGS